MYIRPSEGRATLSRAALCFFLSKWKGQMINLQGVNRMKLWRTKLSPRPRWEKVSPDLEGVEMAALSFPSHYCIEWELSFEWSFELHTVLYCWTKIIGLSGAEAATTMGWMFKSSEETCLQIGLIFSYSTKSEANQITLRTMVLYLSSFPFSRYIYKKDGGTFFNSTHLWNKRSLISNR